MAESKSSREVNAMCLELDGLSCESDSEAPRFTVTESCLTPLFEGLILYVKARTSPNKNELSSVLLELDRVIARTGLKAHIPKDTDND